MMDILLILIGVVLLYFGGDLLVRNASKLASSWGISPMVIGLTIVAFGTSSPELAASLLAAIRDSPEIALGNVVGSNTANIAFILALTVLIAPVRATARFLKREMPIMVGAAALLPILLLGGKLGRIEGVVLLLLLAGFVLMLFRGDEKADVEEEFSQEYSATAAPSPWPAVLGALLGLGLLVGGAQSLVTGAISLARGFGVPELIIGLTLVAVGTSLPELATSMIAAIKGESDIALGNIVGSNIFNILGILGVTALVRPLGIPFDSVAVDLWVMLGVSVLLVPFLVTGLRLGRREGAVFMVLYVVYVVYLYTR